MPPAGAEYAPARKRNKATFAFYNEGNPRRQAAGLGLSGELPHESPRHRQGRPRARPGLEAGPIAAGAAGLLRPATPAPPSTASTCPSSRIRAISETSSASQRRKPSSLTVVGPEEPLAQGIVDAFQKEGLKVFGPSNEAAQLEASKVFAKQLMRHADVPTAEFRVFDHPEPARTYIQTREYPVVVKADGLAAGKGVIVCKTTQEALAAVERIMVREEFGRAAGRQIIVEKKLDGEELSILALVSGRTIVPLPPTQDHKAAFDDDQGPNTGGMGAYCPAPLGTPKLLAEVDADVLVPTVHALKRSRKPFRGVLYAGLMVTSQGPRVLEFNCRFGDPETQPLLMRLQDRTCWICCWQRWTARWTSSRRGPGLGSAAVGVRRAGERRLSGNLLEGQGHHRSGRGGQGAGREGVPRRHARGERPAGDGRRPRAGRDGARRHPDGGPAAGV